MVQNEFTVKIAFSLSEPKMVRVEEQKENAESEDQMRREQEV